MASLLDMIGTADGTPSSNYLKGGRTVIKASRVSWREPTAKIPRASFRIDGEILKSSAEKHATEIGQTGTMNLNFKFPNDDLARMRRALSALGTSIGVGNGPDGACSEAEAAERAAEFTMDSQPLVGSIVTVVAQEDPQKGDPSKTFTKYEVVLPTAKDLEGIDL